MSVESDWGSERASAHRGRLLYVDLRHARIDFALAMLRIEHGTSDEKLSHIRRILLTDQR